MELSQTKPIRIFDDHNRSIGNINANFYNGSGHQHINIPIAEPTHHLVLFARCHLSVK